MLYSFDETQVGSSFIVFKTKKSHHKLRTYTVLTVAFEAETKAKAMMNTKCIRVDYNPW